MTALCGALGTCAGAWIKVFSVHPDLFYVGFIGVNFNQKFGIFYRNSIILASFLIKENLSD